MIFKIVSAEEWSKATTTGIYEGSPDDHRDGFVHLSTREQLRGTLEKHFKHKDDLVIIALEASQLGPTLKWEHSRGGELFPHLYGSIPISTALWHRSILRNENGQFQIDEEWFAC